ncbi:NUDIX hydrolase [Micrococcoides hystricis]|uniref:NUDIX domain-containing protein n=1 Tax=Micrococcoides hystricis TaxID=1572761 RepID=A0ABV6PBY3_9MICC
MSFETQARSLPRQASRPVSYVPAANVSERARLSPQIQVSTVIFGLYNNKDLWIPLVKRIRAPYLGQWALPGGPLTAAETMTDVAYRSLKATTDLAPAYLEQLYAFGGLGQQQAPRTVSIAYWAILPADEINQDAHENVRWFRADEIAELDLAFDHNTVIEYALWRLRNKVEYSSIGYDVLGEKFTIAQLREVYEAILGKPIDPGNFSRQVRANPDLEATEEFLTGGKHRPPRLYRYTGAADRRNNGPLSGFDQ